MPIEDPGPHSAGFRISPQQESLVAQASAGEIIQCAAVLRRGSDAARLHRALLAVAGVHEILRTTLQRSPGMRIPVQVVHDRLPLEWSAGEREGPPSLDIERGPVLRAQLVTPADRWPSLVLSAPAACADSHSLVGLLADLAAVDGGAAVPADPVQYADYAEWRHEVAAQAEASDGRSFWRRQLESVPPSPQLLFARPLASSLAGSFVPVDLSGRLRRGLRAAAAAAGVVPALFLEAAWHALLARVSDADELLMAGWCDGRRQPELARAVGPYAQPVPIRSRFDQSTSLAEVVDQVRRARARAEQLQDHATAAELTTVLAGGGLGFAGIELPPARGPMTAFRTPSPPPARLRAMLHVIMREDRIAADICYDPTALERTDAGALSASLRALVADALADPARPVRRLRLIDAEQRGRIATRSWAPPAGQGASSPVHQRFERQARLTPDAPAVADSRGSVSYAELNAAANRLAHLLRTHGVGRGATVGLAMERTTALMAAVLGVLKAGAAYLPLNFEHPPVRLAHQLSETSAAAILTESRLLGRLPGFGGEVVCIDRDRELIAALPDHDPGFACSSDDLAYVMYTSGSTGLPKGVRVTHANLANYAAPMAERLTAEDGRCRFGVVTAISTDLGNTCVFPPLLSGGCIVLISPTAATDPGAFAAELRGAPLDVLKITPSHVRGLLEGDRVEEIMPRRWLVLGGEPLDWQLAERLASLAPGCRILNHYGPTEATIGCLVYEVAEARSDCRTVPIGHPLPGVRAYVLDGEEEPVPAGVAGELYIAGAGVAAGYAGPPRERGLFRADPFAPGRMYRTGDRVRCLRDGALEFLGRIDAQLKIRGFRVEPGEIEAALVRHPAVRQAAVVARADASGEQRLTAYVVGAVSLAVEPLRAFLAQSLPEYMVPARFVALNELPFTPSGKVDRRALEGTEDTGSVGTGRYVAPRSPVERTLAEIWRELLGVQRVGVEDDFFALGGHSLLAARVVARIRSDLALDLPLAALFTHPTIAALARELLSVMGTADDPDTARLLAELGQLGDEEAERLLAEERR